MIDVLVAYPRSLFYLISYVIGCAETLEASSSCNEEVRRLRTRNLELEQNLGQLRHHQQQQVKASLPFLLYLAHFDHNIFIFCRFSSVVIFIYIT